MLAKVNLHNVEEVLGLGLELKINILEAGLF